MNKNNNNKLHVTYCVAQVKLLNPVHPRLPFPCCFIIWRVSPVSWFCGVPATFLKLCGSLLWTQPLTATLLPVCTLLDKLCHSLRCVHVHPPIWTPDTPTSHILCLSLIEYIFTLFLCFPGSPFSVNRITPGHLQFNSRSFAPHSCQIAFLHTTKHDFSFLFNHRYAPVSPCSQHTTRNHWKKYRYGTSGYALYQWPLKFICKLRGIRMRRGWRFYWIQFQW